MNEQTNMATRYEREIPEGYTARIEGGKVVFELQKSENERIRKGLIKYLKENRVWYPNQSHQFYDDAIAYLEKQKYEYEVFEPVESTLEYKIGFNDGKESIQKAEWSEEDYNDKERVERMVENYAEGRES